MKEHETETTIVKGGETVAHVIIRRDFQGLSFRVHTSPKIEEFMRNLGDGEVVDAMTIGRNWQIKGQKDIMCYDLRRLTGRLMSGNINFRLDRLGQGLILNDNNEDGGPLVTGGGDLNLSFIRIVGAGEGGVTVNLRGVYSEQAVATSTKLVARAIGAFYRDYIKPVESVIQVITSPVEGSTYQSREDTEARIP